MEIFDELQARYRDSLSLNGGSCRSFLPPDPTPTLEEVYEEDERLSGGGLNEVLERGLQSDLGELGLTEPTVSRERSV